MLARKYAQALYNAATADKARPEAAAKNFVELLKSRGQAKLLPSVLSEYKKIIEKASRRGSAIVRVAHEKDAQTYGTEVARVLEDMGIKEKPTRVVDEAVVGGVRVETHGAIYDRTYRRGLILIYNDIVTE